MLASECVRACVRTCVCVILYNLKRLNRFDSLHFTSFKSEAANDFSPFLLTRSFFRILLEFYVFTSMIRFNSFYLYFFYYDHIKINSQ